MSRDLSRRSDETELMDADDVDNETFRDCLYDLARVNVVSFGHRPTLPFFEALRRRGRLELGRPIDILDVGSGYSDLLRAVDRWATGDVSDHPPCAVWPRRPAARAGEEAAQ